MNKKVPFGAQAVFLIQHVPHLVMVVLFALLLPAFWLWSQMHESGKVFLAGALDSMRSKYKELEAHRDKVVRMYNDGDE